MTACRIAAPTLGSNASILMYHSIGHNPSFFTTAPEDFDQQLRYLRKKGFRFSTLSELVALMEEGKDISNVVCLTFDDGYEDNYTTAFPLLIAYGIPATIFLTTGKIGGVSKTREGAELRMLDHKQINEMIASGLCEFMPHTASHAALTKIDVDAAKAEIESSKEAVEQLTGKPAMIFAYPQGKTTRAVVRYLSDSGWRAAVTVQPGLVSRRSNLLLLPRNPVDSSTTMAQFACLVSRGMRLYTALRRRARLDA